MIAMVRKLLRLDGAEPKPVDPDAAKAKHEATLRRADRLLRMAEGYRAADAARRERHS